MTFTLACGDVMPGCAARFESQEHDDLMAQVALHAAHEHGLSEITPEVADAIAGKVVYVA